MITIVRKYGITAVFGLLIGLMFAPLSLLLHGTGMGFYDAAVPVLSMKGVIVARTAESVDVRIAGSKNRNCAYMNIQAYTGVGVDDAGKPTKHAYIERVDRPEMGLTRPKGMMDIGVWRIWPVEVNARITVFVQHSCEGRIVLTKVAEVQL